MEERDSHPKASLHGQVLIVGEQRRAELLGQRDVQALGGGILKALRIENVAGRLPVDDPRDVSVSVTMH